MFEYLKNIWHQLVWPVCVFLWLKTNIYSQQFNSIEMIIYPRAFVGWAASSEEIIKMILTALPYKNNERGINITLHFQAVEQKQLPFASLLFNEQVHILWAVRSSPRAIDLSNVSISQHRHLSFIVNTVFFCFYFFQLPQSVKRRMWLHAGMVFNEAIFAWCRRKIWSAKN